MLSESLRALLATTLAGTGIDVERALALAAGAEPSTPTEHAVAAGLRSGFGEPSAECPVLPELAVAS
ncbi:MAG TPA: hypothetical protein VHD87_15570 [Acidimicrobiales bacterium]|nr:hypothetical protein [Acidimicrobiales bacterium]